MKITTDKVLERIELPFEFDAITIDFGGMFMSDPAEHRDYVICESPVKPVAFDVPADQVKYLGQKLNLHFSRGATLKPGYTTKRIAALKPYFLDAAGLIEGSYYYQLVREVLGDRDASPDGDQLRLTLEKLNSDGHDWVIVVRSNNADDPLEDGYNLEYDGTKTPYLTFCSDAVDVKKGLEMTRK